MDKETRRKLLSGYLSDEEAEKLSTRLSKSKREAKMETLHSLIVADKPEYIRGSATIFDDTSGSGEFIIGRFELSNVTDSIQTARLEIVLNRSKSIVREYTLTPMGSKDGIIRLSKDESDGLDNTSVHCRVEISDSLDRSVFRSVSTIVMTTDRSAPKIDAKLSFNVETSDGKLVKLNVRFESADEIERNCTINVLSDAQSVLERRYLVKPGLKVDDVIEIPLDSKMPYSKLKAVAVCEGNELVKTSKEIISVNDPVSPTTKHIFGDCAFGTVIDINDQHEGMVIIGVLGIVNSDDSPQRVSWSISLDGSTVDSSSAVIASGSKAEKPIVVPAKIVSRDDTFNATVRCTLFDSDSMIILDRVSQLTFRSRFDLDLSKVQVLTAKYVNPLDPKIKNFVDSKDGLLAKAMGDKYYVSGYMDPDNIMPQLEAVYNAIRDYGMAYVNDTSTLIKDGCFQRVRDPATVLENHSGNCIELSILMASIYESMGFEPIIVFPDKHAIVGVVMNSNVYPSNSKMPVDAKVLTIRLGNDNGFIDALFLESTMVADKTNTFSKAILSAVNQVTDEMAFIMSNKRFSLISFLRNVI